ncbi:glycosyltransferase family 4 protein [Bifidobacterium sp.]|uniref:glycosyltransferase family 4 protein n=1 Tax=Bifidobacterium sp. TaxID=41200 RepID=UPI0025C1BCD9|nr:glycosyltransferase family 4 protein [Bifidobacterium sp.]MCH4208535.1 glycosyltransferase family 4 protein [Bifidobacterium sp.]MCI1224221.1 glycosyltransferase family 4 protein [Bifidobacterium sp.]
MAANAAEADDPLHGRKLNIGIISPYSFETPGGVQFHIRDFAKELTARGHHVEVLAPGRRTKDMPLWVHANGSSFSIHYNGSVARLSYFGVVGLQARRWVEQGQFDILHLHEPETPSLSHKPLTMKHHPPMIATFHAAFTTYPRALLLFEPYLRRYLDPLSDAICVSEAALDTAAHYLPEHIDAHIIPNGISTAFFAHAEPAPRWLGTAERPTIGFLGRMGDERKGFIVFAQAAQRILGTYPHARFLCVGDGEGSGRRILNRTDPSGALAEHCEFLGRISDEDKARFYRSLSVYIAPQTGGESFGIVLAEAMAAACPVVASDLDAFRAVADNGAAAALFENGDGRDCARAVCGVLADSSLRERLCAEGSQRSQLYDWSGVTGRVLEIYARALS